MKKIQVIDLFCGVGGLSFGLKKAQIDVIAGIDIDGACHYPYTANNKSRFIHKSVTELTGGDLKQLFSSNAIKVLAGCAPCQPFSSYSQGPRGKHDAQWSLLGEFARLVAETGPDIVTMENVPALIKHPIFEKFVGFLQSGDGMQFKYNVSYKIVACDQYGLPQTRKRLVLLASRFGNLDFNRPSNKTTTVMETIGQLPPLEAGQTNAKDPLHQSAKLSPNNLARIRSSRPGGTWRDWDQTLVADCHRKASGRSYSSVYGRMEWEKPSPTMTTQFYGFGNGRFGHPNQDRAITLREGAMLQSFPKSYKFVKKGAPIHFSTIGRLIGNAVPPLLGQVIGESIQIHLNALTNNGDTPQVQ
jgi:DNA (cytosine-5)-methyltransferase 1